MDDESFIPILLAQLNGFEEENDSVREFTEQELAELLCVEEYEIDDESWYSLTNTSVDFNARLIDFIPERNWLLTMSNGESLHHKFAKGPACLAAKNGYQFAAYTCFNGEMLTISKQGTILSLKRAENGHILWIFYKIDPEQPFGQKDILLFNEDTHWSHFNGGMLMQADMPSTIPTLQHYCDFYLDLIADETIADFMPSIDNLQAHIMINVQIAGVQKTFCDYMAKWAGELFVLTVTNKMESIDPHSGNKYFLVLNDANQTFRVSRLDDDGNEIIDYFGNYCVLIICLIIGQFKVEDEHARFDVIQEQSLKLFSKTRNRVEDHVDD
ncbi:hypothetical protein O7R08_15490 [Vibrio alginolyticus]|uniref:hypothetical protein n=1 Tax=Vibrio alginolyticus TaxID=663 RepID=UPI0022DD0053|nr:hypothetical protein [Vibrio alginolyticus]MDA0407344.1 hypothetical protein [Vibrio alginolyticus]